MPSTARPRGPSKKKAASPPKHKSSMISVMTILDNSDQKENKSRMRSVMQSQSVSRIGSNENLPTRKESRANFDHSLEDKSQEDDNRRRAKASVMGKPGLEIPQTYFKIADVAYNIVQRDRDDVQLSNSMVVRVIARNSPLNPYLLVGDQILEVNGHPILSGEEFSRWLHLQPKGMIRLVRPWNNTHCGDRLPVKRNRESSYLIVDFHRLPGMSNGFEIMKFDKRPEVVSTTTGNRGPHAFFQKDRLLDVDSTPVKELPTLNDIRLRFTSTLSQKSMCSFLVERPLTLRSSPNTSLTAARASKPQVIEMGDDACEIGAREATRLKAMGDRYQVRSVLRSNATNTTTTTTRSEEDLHGGAKKTWKGKKKSRRSVSIEGKLNKISKLPSDVKEGTPLQKVTAKSGIIGFVRSYLSRN